MTLRIYKAAGLLVPLLVVAAVLVLLFIRRPGPSAYGLSVVPLTFDGPGVSNQFPVASPDGLYILFQRCDEPAVTRAPDGQPIYHFEEDQANWDIYRMRIDGSERIRLTDSPATEDEPAWSPEGDTIAYRVYGKATFAIWLMDADGRNKRPLVAEPNSHSKAPSFSADGGTVVFYANRAARQSWNIFTIDLAGRKIEQLTRGAFEDKHPQLTPDGREVIFHSDRKGLTIKTRTHDKMMGVYSLDVATGQITLLTDPKETRDDRHAFLSPDGRFIVYHSLGYAPDPQQPGQYQKVDEDIYVMTRDGRNRVNVTRGDLRQFKHPSWSADGKGIYCVFKEKGASQKRGGAWNLCRIDVSEALKRLE